MSTDSAQGTTTGGTDSIQGLLQGHRLRLRFPGALEAAYRLQMQQRQLDQLQQGWWAILLFYVLLGIGTHAEVLTLSHPAHLQGNLAVWWAVYVAEGLVVAALLAMPHLRLLRAHYPAAIAVLAFAAIVTITVGTSAFPDPYFNQHSSYVVVCVLAIIHGLGLLRCVPTVAVSFAAGLVAWLVIRQFDLWLDWGLFRQYMLGSILVGALLSFMVEQRNRRSFLQGELLRLEHARLDALTGELARLSREDALTGLANRRYFNEALEAEWERARREARPLALVFIDLDCFKAYNDRQGHLAGDAVLAAFGRVLTDSLRRPGDLAARFGGEEFVLLLPATPLPGALAVARQVQAGLAAQAIPHPASAVAAQVTASVGVAALLPGPGVHSAQLLALADEAAYAAKAAGRNCIRVAGEAPIAESA